jgi:predicted transcriptional regulator
MIIGYNFFLKRIAAMMDSKENLTMGTIESRLNLRQDEFKDLLNIMEKRGDLKAIVQKAGTCEGKCAGCRSSCASTFSSSAQKSTTYYQLTEKGRSVCGKLS